LVARDPGAATADGKHLVNDDDEFDAFAEQLAACDLRLEQSTADEVAVPDTLPVKLRADLVPAVDCLRRLKELRQRRAKALPVGALQPAQAAVFGRFELREELGRGGFGVVFRAFDPWLKREVALKLPRPDCLLNAEMRRRFLHEGRAAAALAHRNITPVHEAGEINGVCYLASAYCAGPSLAAWLHGRVEPVPPIDAARIVASLADGVEYAHAHGILHRDLKPANVLLESVVRGPWSVVKDKAPPQDVSLTTDHGPRTTDCIPMVTDFGLAKMADGTGEQTRTGVLLGTPAYMAPEQAEGRTGAIGPATDVYALGVILYELLTLRRPFAGASDLDVLRQIAQDEPAALRRMRRRIPRDVESICLRCLQKDPRRRYGSAGELARDLRRFLGGEPTLARSPSRVERAVKWARRRPAAAALIVVSTVGATLLLAAVLWHSYTVATQNEQLIQALADAKDQRAIATRKADEVAANAYAAQVHLAAEVLLAGRTGEMAALLDPLRPEPGATDYREFAWHYLRRLARSDQWLRGHRHGVRRLAMASDGKSLASIDDTGVIVWDLGAGKERLRLGGFAGKPRSVAIAPDGRLIAAGCLPITGSEPTEVRVWNLQSGELVACHRDAAPMPGQLAFSPDSQTIAITRGPAPGDQQGVLCLWHLEMQQKRMFLADVHVAMAAAFAPDGKTLAVSCGQDAQACRLLTLDLRTGAISGAFTGATNLAHDLCYAPDGATLFSWGQRDRLRLWDAATGRERSVWKDEASSMPQVGMSANGQLVATLIDDPARVQHRAAILRDLATGKLRAERPRGETPWSIALAPDGQTLALGYPDSNILLRRLDPIPAVHCIAAHDKEAWAVAFAPDGRTLASASDDHSIRLWDVATRKPIATLADHRSLVTALAYSRDGRILASASFDFKVKLWDTARNTVSATLRGHEGRVRAVAHSPDGQILASAGSDATIRLWRLPAGEPIGVLGTHEKAIEGVAFSPTERRLASAGIDQQLILWDLDTGLVITRVRSSDALLRVAYAPDGAQLAVAGADGIPRLWDSDLRSSRAVIGAHQGSIECVAFSPDGKTLATGGSDRTVCLWHVASGQKLISYSNLPDKVHSVAFSPDGRLLAAALFDGSLRIWPSESPAR
jgi:eukaryotic-like serine/threonine-protein kinase